MGLVTQTLEGMYNGVSQRPAPLRMSGRFARQVNWLSDIVDGISKRPNTEYINTLESNATEDTYVHTINRSLDEQFKVIFTADENQPVEIYDLEGNSYDVEFDESDDEDYVFNSDPKKYTRALSLSNRTFILDTKTTVKAEADFGDLDPSTIDKYCYAWIREGIPEIDYSLTVYDINGDKITKATIEAPLSDSEQVATTDTQQIAEDLVDEITGDLSDDYDIYADGSVIFFQYTGSEPWQDANIKVETSDGYGDTAFIAINSRVNDKTELPPKGIEYYPIAITGGQAEDEGSYYVEWNSSEQVYLETRRFFDFEGNELPNVLDSSTMPRVMEQQDDDSFLIKKADWAENLVGDEETSPMPSFVDSTINDIFFYRDRIGFLSDENIIFSKANNYTDFFPETATAVLDMDPIDVTVASRKNVNLRHGVAFAKSLIIFSENVQFEVGSSGRNLTPQSITIDPSTYFETNPYCEPVGAGPNIYFVVPKGDYSSFREYFVQTDTLITDARNIAGQVPKYIPKDIDKLASSNAYGLMFALSTEEQDTLYVYSHHREGEEQVQSSWSKWIFDDETILDIAINGNYLFLVTKQDDEVCLLRADLRMTEEDELLIKVFLDRKVKVEAGESDYVEDEDYTEIKLPYNDSSDNFEVVDANSGGELAGVEKVDSDTIHISGDHTDTNMYIGKPFKSLLEYSPFYVNNRNSKMPDIQGKLQLKTLTISFTKTGEFEFKATPYPRDDIRPYAEDDEEIEEYLEKNVISGVVLGEAVLDTPPIATGERTLPITANAKRIKIELIADSYLPANFQLTAFEAEYSNRAQHR